jgi:hypothetical protein
MHRIKDLFNNTGNSLFSHILLIPLPSLPPIRLKTLALITELLTYMSTNPE